MAAQQSVPGHAVPTMPGGPLAGSALDLLRDVLVFMDRCRDSGHDLVRARMGPAVLRQEVYVVSHPDGIQQVLTDRTLTKQTPAYRDVAATFGDGLLTLDGEDWERHRRVVQPQFTARRVAGFVPEMDEEARDLVRRLAQSAAGSAAGSPDGSLTPVDLVPHAIRYTLRVVGRVVFGTDIEEVAEVVERQVPVVNRRLNRRALAPVHLPRWVPTPSQRRYEAARGEVCSAVDAVVARSGRGLPDGSSDLVGLLAHATDPRTGRGLSAQEVRAEALIFVLAGYETTSTALAATLHLLGSEPQWQERVRAEAREVLGAVEEGGGPVTAADVDRLSWAGRCVQEGLRLYAAAPAVARVGPPGTSVLGHDLPAGAHVIVPIWSVHRDPRWWPEPERFDPARFEPAAVAARHRYAWLPFGGGARACIGTQFAMLEATLAVARVVSAFEVVTPPAPPPVVAEIALRFAEPVPASLTPRRDLQDRPA
ncbi:MAG TPA: cytochrome P450 [Dermatophilaceae bacterium]|nr:cytochrome P450 [Dermatophilaceae bacterium]